VSALRCQPDQQAGCRTFVAPPVPFASDASSNLRLFVYVAPFASDGGIAAAIRAAPQLRQQHAVASAARANQPPAVPLPPSVQSYPGALQPTAITHKLHQSKWRLQVGCGTERDADSQLMTPQERGWTGVAAGAVRALRLHRAALRKRHESHYAGGAQHWEQDAYKRGGGLAHAHPLPAVGCDDFSQEEFGAAVKELTRAIRAAYQSRRSALSSLSQSSSVEQAVVASAHGLFE
jgi:hypothetical protein